MRIKVDTDFTGLIAKGKHKNLINKELLATMDLATNEGEKEIVLKIKEKNLVGVTRHLVDGIRGKVISNIYGRVGIEGPASVYGEVMEKGRHKGSRMPPPDALERWIYLKVGKSKPEAKQLKFAYAKSISKKGIKGRHYFKEATKILKPKLNSLFDNLKLRLEKKLSDN